MGGDMKECAGAICGWDDPWEPAGKICNPFAIMSIKPKYAELILRGRKRWEFRKRTMRKLIGMDTLIYATYPRCQIVDPMMKVNEA